MARAAEGVGFDSLWLGDHLLYDLPGGVTRGPWEAWTALAALAAATERVELGPLVASTSFHAPAMLAKQAATFAAVRARVDEAAVQAGRMPGEVAATAAVLVSLPGGTGRLTGDVSSGPVRPVQGSPADISGHLEAMAGAGATHLQLVVDPITMGAIEMLGDVLATLDRDWEMPDAVIKPVLTN